MQRVRWSNAENELMFNSLVREISVNPSLSDEAALRNAQLQLPATRRAKINYPKLKTYRPMIGKARERAKELKIVAPAPEPAPAPAPAPELVESLEATVGKTLVALVDQICKMVIERVQVVVTPERLTSTPPPIAVDCAAARANVRERESLADAPGARDVRRVLVIGLMGGQVDSVIAKCKHSPIMLKFLTADEARTQKFEWQSPIVLMTKFVSHAVQLKAQQATQQLHYCNGGVTECTAIIDRILQGAK